MKNYKLVAEMEPAPLFKESNKIETIFENINISYILNPEVCIVYLAGSNKKKVEDCFYMIYEMSALVFGYFFNITSLKIDNQTIRQRDIGMYETCAALKTNCLKITEFNHIVLSSDTLMKYQKYRCLIDKKTKNMTGELLHSFFYTLSETYKNVTIDHRLTLLLHVCNGIYENPPYKRREAFIRCLEFIFEDHCSEFSDHFKLFKIVDSSAFLKMLEATRHEITHFRRKNDSASNQINTDLKGDLSGSLLYTYLLFMMSIFIRLKFFEIFNKDIEFQTRYAFDTIYDWVVEKSNRDDLDFKLPINQLRREIKNSF